MPKFFINALLPSLFVEFVAFSVEYLIVKAALTFVYKNINALRVSPLFANVKILYSLNFLTSLLILKISSVTFYSKAKSLHI
jgi:hypothetical protein